MSDSDFQEGHSGGKFSVSIKTDSAGQKSMQFGFSHSRPVQMAMIGVYALPQGIPTGMIALGGIGQAWNQPPFPGCLPIFISSDSQGKFGYECPKCSGYWRSIGHSSKANKCPYCGLVSEGHYFLTSGQVRYVEACCEMIGESLEKIDNGKAEVDMDQVADLVGKNTEKPKFYYHEESQQNKFNCNACGCFNDILGRYGYCCVCGTHNAAEEFSKDIKLIRSKLKDLGFENATKNTVAAFDSFARCLMKQLVQNIPMTERRKKKADDHLFHNLEVSAKNVEIFFDINILSGLREEDLKFVFKMFHRRHVYEHNGGEVDQKYIDDSGDAEVRVKQVIKESNESVQRLADLVLKISKNFDEGFHNIFPANQGPIEMAKRRNSRT